MTTFRRILVFSILFLRVCIASAQAAATPESIAAQAWAQARTDMMTENLDQLASLFKKADDFYGIELIIAGPMNRKVESSFGHALLRFVGKGSQALDDSVVGFVADVDEPKLSYAKGFRGGYKVIPHVGSLGAFIHRYLENEERPLYRYIIPTDAQIRKNLIATLQRWVKSPDEMGKYKFVTNNCASVLAELLNQSGISMGVVPPVPSMLPRHLAQRYILPYPVLPTLTITPTFDKLAKELRVPVNDLKAGHWPKEAIDKFHTLSTSTLAQLYYRAAPSDEDLRKVMIRLILKDGPVDLSAVYGIKKVPNVLYELCDSNDCAEQLRSAMKESRILEKHPSLPERAMTATKVTIAEQATWLDPQLRKYVEHTRRMN